MLRATQPSQIVMPEREPDLQYAPGKAPLSPYQGKWAGGCVVGVLDMGHGRVPARTIPGGTEGPGAGGPGQSTAASAGGATVRAGNPAATEACQPVPAPAPCVGRPSDGPRWPASRQPWEPCGP